MVFLSGFDIASSVCAPVSVSRLTVRGPWARDCRADPQVCRACGDRLGEVGRHTGRDPGRRRARSRERGRHTPRRRANAAGGLFVERRDRHDAAKAQGAASARRARRDARARPGATPPRAGSSVRLTCSSTSRVGVVGGGRGVQRVRDLDAVDGVDDGCRRPDRPRLVGLRLPDEVPAQSIEIADGRGPSR